VGATNSIFFARLILRLTAPIVPRQQREDWYAEWSAKLAAEDERPRHSRGDPRRSLLGHALGAPVDALWMRQRAIADFEIADDLRVGWRQLRQQAAFGLTAIGILALGMSASITAFSVVTQLLLRPLPYPEPDRIVTLWQRQADSQTPLDVAPGNFLDWRDRPAASATWLAPSPTATTSPGGIDPRCCRRSS
jgi:hypothetical protein